MNRTILCAALLFCSQVALAEDDHATAPELSARMKGKGARVGAASKSTLESPDFVDITVKKGYCYTVEVKLGQGSSWKAGRRPTLYIPTWPTNPTSVGPILIGETGAV